MVHSQHFKLLPGKKENNKLLTCSKMAAPTGWFIIQRLCDRMEREGFDSW